MATATTQNKGEWSEIYACLKLLADGAMVVFDHEDRTAMSVQVTDVKMGGRLFVIKGTTIVGSTGKLGTGKPHFKLCAQQHSLKVAVVSILAQIKKGGRGAFPLQDADALAQELGVSSKSDRTHSKGDLQISFVRPDTGARSKAHEVSVKSWLGQNPTLFNASTRGTRVAYEITGVNEVVLRGLSSNTPRENLKAVRVAGGAVNFARFHRAEFAENLKILRATQAVTFALLAHFERESGGTTSAAYLESKTSSAPRFKASFRDFLRAAALGMTASHAWDAEMSASDNYLIVREDGSLVCLIGRNSLEQHLYSSVYLDTPSTSETKHDYGKVYHHEGRWLIDLNLQVRLKAGTFPD